MKTITPLALLLLLSLSLNGQTRVVYGKLTAFNRYPLQNIEVQAKKSKAKTTSDSTGMFSIVCKNKDVVQIKPKAFKATSKKIKPDTDTLRINLVFVDTPKNREIATGYGHINEEDLSYAVNHLELENNDFCTFDNIYDLIQEKFPSVQVSRDMHQGSIVIRGSSSVNLESEALYVVDGMMVDEIYWISPCEVKSIEIIKDGMASYYGARGTNGVVVIETKRGGS